MAEAAPGSEHGDGGEPVDDRWVRLRAVWRVLVVVAAFLPLFLAYARDRKRFLLFGRGRTVSPETRRERAEYLLETLLDLGPAFIKVGQILSTRVDVLPMVYIDVLSQLQDRVPPAPWPDIEPVIEDDLGPVDEVFDAFDREPISGASLGQVYTARVDGERVAVKVLRPNIRRRVEADLRVVATLLPPIVRFAPEGQAFTLENLADEFTATIREEMDYANEARMLATMRENFADDDSVRIPRPLFDYSEDRVLTMEYVDGTKIDDVEGIEAMGVDRTAVVDDLMNAYIQMIVEDGQFHADPHPGNLAVQADGTIVFYDFGITGRLPDRLQDQLMEFYVAIANDDVDAVIDAFVELGALDPSADRAVMRQVFELVFENLRGREIDENQVQELVSEFQGTMYEFPMRLPQNLALIVRVSTVLEGVCRTLDPTFDFIAVIEEYVSAQGYSEEGVAEVVAFLRSQLRDTTRGLVGVPPAVEGVLDRTLRETLTASIVVHDDEGVFTRLARQIVYTLLLASGVVTTTLFLAAERLPETVLATGWTVVVAALLVRSFRSRSGIGVSPQFTRQNLKERRDDR